VRSWIYAARNGYQWQSSMKASSESSASIMAGYFIDSWVTVKFLKLTLRVLVCMPGLLWKTIKNFQIWIKIPGTLYEDLRNFYGRLRHKFAIKQFLWTLMILPYNTRVPYTGHCPVCRIHHSGFCLYAFHVNAERAPFSETLWVYCSLRR
jgi:hypothetical protein